MTDRRSNPRPARDRPAKNGTVTELRPDPQDTQTAAEAAAEQAVIGAMLTDPTVIGAVTKHIGPADYWQHRHGTIHRAITTLQEQNLTPDPITVAQHLTAVGDIQHLPDGALYLHACIAAVPTTANAGYYAGLIADHARRRNLAALAARLTQAAAVEDTGRRLELATGIREELDTTLSSIPAAEADTWTPIDLGPALSGGVLTPPPVLLARSDGMFLLYLGRLHSLSGEPEAGKTWVALIGVHQALTDGQHVIYLDFEDTPEGIVTRLLAMGTHPDHIRARLHYIRPDRPIDAAGRKHIDAIVADNFTVLCVIDGVTEAMTLHGLDPYNNPDAAKFYEALPRHITRLKGAPAVLLIDHVPKDEDRPKRYAIGAQHKLAGLDGAAYVVDIVKPFAPNQPGVSRIRVAKDRPGQVRRNATGGVIAELHVGGDYPVVTVELRPPLATAAATTPDGHWRPTMLMDRVSRWLEAHPGASQNEIEKAVRGRSTNVRAAVEALALEKYIRREPGEGRQWKHYVKEPFRDGEAIDLEEEQA